MSEKLSAMRKSGDFLESPDSVRQNRDKPPLEQLKYKQNQRKNQRKKHTKIDIKEHEKADIDLTNELLLLKVSADKNKQDEIENEAIETNKEISAADKIKNYTESIRQGKSQTEILSLLISKFENEEAVSTWVENWRNFQKLHQFAENKPPQERKAIQRIIAKSDFSSESSFENSIAEISQSTEISAETKLEISRNFGLGTHVDSVDGMDYQLQQVKEHTKAIEKEIDKKNNDRNSINAEIEDLENEITNLPYGSPKRQELEEKLEQKKEALEQTENEIDRLEKGKPKEAAFVLREGFSAKLNPDGS